MMSWARGKLITAGFLSAWCRCVCKMGGRSQWPASRTVCAMTNARETHRAPLSQHLDQEANGSYREILGELSKDRVSFSSLEAACLA